MQERPLGHSLHDLPQISVLHAPFRMVEHDARIEDLIRLVRRLVVQSPGPHIVLLTGPNLGDDFTGTSGDRR